jgi:hypothetical protein
MFRQHPWIWILFGSTLIVTLAMTEEVKVNNKTDNFDSKPFNLSKKAGKSKMR